ncbi:2'-5' RNA ligase family protein [Streptomyces sp. WMMB 322]|uniref:2'-5' RNA ligase family protein n=1 Tax=Streptomyces sp. WMMB 322 TaxID=1286821 RepID=UPI0006E33849|nr:2'-5' RNA ligase family protein [Streptomyces sp. WMMB 322]SCK07312.1 2'-5' RNA ligase [Streptomyces sp. WMMB 322]
MRLFTALLPPDRVLDASGQLADKVAELRSMDGGGQLRWTERANWHITLAFYGEVGGGQLDELHERLSRAARRGRPLGLRIAGGGHFGHRALWAAVTGAPSGAEAPAAAGGAGHRPGGEGVRMLAAATAAAGRRVGLGTDEPRRFRAHLTLARARSRPFDMKAYTAALDEYAGEPWTAGELALVRSNLPESGVQGEQPRYEQIAAWPLGG